MAEKVNSKGLANKKNPNLFSQRFPVGCLLMMIVKCFSTLVRMQPLWLEELNSQKSVQWGVGGCLCLLPAQVWLAH